MHTEKMLRWTSAMLLLSALLAFSFGTGNLKEEPMVGHWSFDEIQDKKVVDNSNYESHGEIEGNPKRSTGIIGERCLEFDGNGDYIEITENGKTPSQFHNLGAGSISVWFKARNIPVGESILPILYYGNENGCSNMFDASNEGLIIEIAHGGVYPNSRGIFYTVFSNPCELPSFCYDSHSDPHLADKQGIIEENKWYHFVVVVGKNYNTGYLNGKEMRFRHYNFNNAGASQFFSSARKHQKMWIGKGFWDHGKVTYFDGFIDDLRIYSRPLKAKEVRSLYKMRHAD